MRKFINKIFNTEPITVFVSAACGTSAATLFYINYFQLPLFSKRNFLISCFIALLITLIILFIYNIWFKPIINEIPAKKSLILVLIALILSAVFAIVLSFTIRPLYFLYPQPARSASASLPEDLIDVDEGVSLSYLHTDFRDISFSELEIKGKENMKKAKTGSIFLQISLFRSLGRELPARTC